MLLKLILPFKLLFIKKIYFLAAPHGLQGVSWPGFEPVSPSGEGWDPNHWTTRESPLFTFPGSSVGKESACIAGDLIRFLGREDWLEKG